MKPNQAKLQQLIHSGATSCNHEGGKQSKADQSQKKKRHREQHLPGPLYPARHSQEKALNPTISASWEAGTSVTAEAQRRHETNSRVQSRYLKAPAPLSSSNMGSTLDPPAQILPIPSRMGAGTTPPSPMWWGLPKAAHLVCHSTTPAAVAVTPQDNEPHCSPGLQGKEVLDITQERRMRFLPFGAKRGPEPG